MQQACFDRKRVSRFIFAGVLLMLSGAAGCKTPPPPPDHAAPPVIVRQTKLPVTLDGELKDVAWSRTPGYTLTHLAEKNLPPREAARAGKEIAESGVVKFLCDDRSLYVGILLEDDDLIHFEPGDHAALTGTGDLVTVMLKAADAPGIWIFSVAPDGCRNSCLLPGRGLHSLRHFQPPEAAEIAGFETRSKMYGTLNQWLDTDTAWSAELCIPRQALQSDGKAFAPAGGWTVLVVRHNFARKFSGVQYSTLPEFPDANFHWSEYYAPLEFQ